MNPLALTPPSVTLAQSVPQDLPETDGPAAGLTMPFLQQCFACFRQQGESGSFSVRAASGKSDAQAISTAIDADMNVRSRLVRCEFPSILGIKNITGLPRRTPGPHFVTRPNSAIVSRTCYQSGK
jgi:hypothetical protein